MKILVTGHKGFIGSYLFNHLKKVGHEVDGIDFPDAVSYTHLTLPTNA